MRMNIDGEYYDAQQVIMHEFKWSSFITEKYESDQMFIVEFDDKDLMIMSHQDLISNHRVQCEGVLRYRAVNLK